jgi:hydrogenase 3 maturation protease
MLSIDSLTNILKAKVVIVCVGNIERGDDSFGPCLAGKIKDKTPYEVIDAGTTPENWTGAIIRSKPDTIIIVDAVDFDGEVGEIRLFLGEELRSGRISTHDISLKLLIGYLKESTRADIYVLGIKPGSNKLEEGLTPSVKASLNNLAKILISTVK